MASAVATNQSTVSTCRDVASPAPVRAWLLTNAPSPYQAELFTAIAKHEELLLDVRFMRSSSSSGRAVASRFGSRTMFGLLPSRFRDEIRLHPRAVWEAAVGRFDFYVLSGIYTSITFLSCALVLTIRRKPWAVWLERPHHRASSTYQTPDSPLGRIRDRVRHWLLSHATRIICIGSAAKDAYQAMGADANRLDVLPYCCDLTRFDAVDRQSIEDVRREYVAGDGCMFLFSGQMIDRKGVDTLLTAFERLADEDDKTVLLLLGDGPSKAVLQQQVADRHRSRVHFLGHMPQKQLPIIFRSADVFVFPSRHDGWGVVINEACAAGLPVITTPQTGAAHDLVDPPHSGYLVDASDEEGFYKAMRSLLNDPQARQQMGERSRELVEAFSPSQGAERFVDCVGRGLAANASGRSPE